MQAAALSQVAEARGGRAGPLHHAVLWAVVSAMLAFAWTGFMASDDAYYASSGVGWAHGFPYVADHFATARALVGIAIAPFVRVFGERELAFVLSTSLFFAATMSVTLQIWSEEESRKVSGVVLERVGLDGLHPADVRKKLDRPNPAVKVFLVGK